MPAWLSLLSQSHCRENPDARFRSTARSGARLLVPLVLAGYAQCLVNSHPASWEGGERSMRSPSPPKPSRLRLALNRDGLALVGSVVELRELMPYAGHADQYRPMLR